MQSFDDMRENVRVALRVLGDEERSSRGMTLIEVLIVLVILASIAGVTSVFVVGQLDKANIEEAKIQAGQLKNLAQQYYVTSSPKAYPDSLDQLVDARLTKKIPQDPWGNEYRYNKTSRTEIEIYSVGPDGVEGTEDDVYPEG